jgi:ribosome biogenesis GTPase / thiamine phosphate phosphatase
LDRHSKASLPEPGRVLSFIGGVYAVRLESGEIVEASIRGRLKMEQRTGDRIVAGDRVRVALQEDGGATIEAVEPRDSELARRAPGRGSRRAKVLVANADQVVIVVAAAEPEPRLRIIDRLLVLAESDQLPSLIVVNKIDLVDADALQATFDAYRAAGYLLHFTSAATGAGVEALGEALCGRDSVLTGPSGVGKSSLLNAIEPGLGLRVGAVSEAVRKGRHTTVSSQLIPLECGGFVADTPGLREVGLWRIPADELPRLFPEFRPLSGGCRFGSTCSHVHEPSCAVQAAVAAGSLSRGRYESYVAMSRDEPEPGW